MVTVEEVFEQSQTVNSDKIMPGRPHKSGAAVPALLGVEV